MHDNYILTIFLIIGLLFLLIDIKIVIGYFLGAVIIFILALIKENIYGIKD